MCGCWVCVPVHPLPSPHLTTIAPQSISGDAYEEEEDVQAILARRQEEAADGTGEGMDADEEVCSVVLCVSVRRNGKRERLMGTLPS